MKISGHSMYVGSRLAWNWFSNKICSFFTFESKITQLQLSHSQTKANLTSCFQRHFAETGNASHKRTSSWWYKRGTLRSPSSEKHTSVYKTHSTGAFKAKSVMKGLGNNKLQNDCIVFHFRKENSHGAFPMRKIVNTFSLQTCINICNIPHVICTIWNEILIYPILLLSFI
jgi:hypothetical protein